MNYTVKLIRGLLLIFLLSGVVVLRAQVIATAKTENQKTNDHCLKCHAHNHFIYDNTVAKTQSKTQDGTWYENRHGSILSVQSQKF